LSERFFQDARLYIFTGMGVMLPQMLGSVGSHQLFPEEYNPKEM
jgi:hypothetical protein